MNVPEHTEQDYRELWLRFVQAMNHAEELELELDRFKAATFQVTTQATLDHVKNIP